MTSSSKTNLVKTLWTTRAGLAAAGLAASLVLLAAPAVAQAPPKDATVGTAPKSAAAERVLELTPAQRLAIYQSITQTQKNNAAPNVVSNHEISLNDTSDTSDTAFFSSSSARHKYQRINRLHTI